MKFITAILHVLAAVLSSAAAEHVHPKLLCTNSTLNISHPINATACSNITAPTSTSLLPTIYTSPPNSSIPPPIFYLYSFNASVDQYDGRAQLVLFSSLLEFRSAALTMHEMIKLLLQVDHQPRLQCRSVSCLCLYPERHTRRRQSRRLPARQIMASLLSSEKEKRYLVRQLANLFHYHPLVPHRTGR